MLYSVFGSDTRQSCLASLLAQDGTSVIHTQKEIQPADVVILPIPTLTAGKTIREARLPFTELLSALPPRTAVWGAGISGYREAAARKEIALHDFSDYDTFTTENVIPTAEGAIQLAMEELPTTINGGKFLIIGYGRIGSRLAKNLTDLGADVTVARRHDDGTLPYRTDRTGSYHHPLTDYDAVFNTVPFPVFSAQDCANTREDCLLIDLASSPGGISTNSHRRLIHALGLPAKVAPKTAAGIMKSVILSEMEESS